MLHIDQPGYGSRPGGTGAIISSGFSRLVAGEIGASQVCTDEQRDYCVDDERLFFRSRIK